MKPVCGLDTTPGRLYRATCTLTIVFRHVPNLEIPEYKIIEAADIGPYLVQNRMRGLTADIRDAK